MAENITNEKAEINKAAKKKLLEKGKKEGTVTLYDIMEAFQDKDLDKDVAENLYETLGNLGIEVINDKEFKADINLNEPDDLDIKSIDEESSEDTETAETETAEIAVPKGISIDDPVRMYLKEIGKIPLLKPHEEVEFARLMSEGDERSKQKLVEANLRLVVSIAKLSLIHI